MDHLDLSAALGSGLLPVQTNPEKQRSGFLHLNQKPAAEALS